MFVKPALIAIALLGISAPALAQEADPLLKETITIAAGPSYIPSYVGSDDYIVVPTVGLRGSTGGFKFQFQGTQGSVDLIREAPGGLDFQLGPVAGFNLLRSRQIKDDQVRALGELDAAIELGGYVGIGKTGVITSAYDTLSATLTYSHDVAGAHDSYLIRPAINYGTPLSRKAYVFLNGYMDIVGKDYGDYYFSVSPGGAVASGLAPFDARKSGTMGYGANLLVNVSLTGDLTGGLSLLGGGGYYRVQGRYADSPIVSVAGDRDQWYGGLGLAYTF